MKTKRKDSSESLSGSTLFQMAERVKRKTEFSKLSLSITASTTLITIFGAQFRV